LAQRVAGGRPGAPPAARACRATGFADGDFGFARDIVGGELQLRHHGQLKQVREFALPLPSLRRSRRHRDLGLQGLVACGAEGFQLGQDDFAQRPNLILPAPDCIAQRRRLFTNLAVHVEGLAGLSQELVGHVLRREAQDGAIQVAMVRTIS